MKLKELTIVLLIVTLAFSCEELYEPPLTTETPLLVVEGHIEAGDVPLPPYVLLTRTMPFYSTISTATINNLFVHDAEVTVSDGTETITLEEVCWSDLPPELQSIVFQTVPDLDTFFVDYCLYTDLSGSMFGEVGRTYSLTVKTDSEYATAATTILEHIPVDSVLFRPAPGGHGDSLLEMRVQFTDPGATEDYYRYFTSTNGGLFYPGFNSVFDDKIVNGTELEFALPRGEPPYRQDGDNSIFGLFRPGDEVVLKWTNIEEDHYNFWNTLEFNRINQGPFGSYTQIQTNITGGIGIWGGSAASYYSVNAEE